MHWISPICGKCSSALVTALCMIWKKFGSNSICVMMLQHPWKIAWRLPFLPTHLISGHFLIGVHHVVQKWIGIGVNLRCVVSDKFGSNSICVMLLQHPWKICMEAAISSYPFNKRPFLLDRRASCCPAWIGTGVNLRCVSDLLLFRQFDPLLLLWFSSCNSCL